MLTFITRLRIMWQLATRVGPVGRAMQSISVIVRYRILQVLEELGVFAYLREPHTYAEILARFNFEDNDYTRLVFDTLIDEKEGVLTKNDATYQLHTDPPIPAWEEFATTVPEVALNLPNVKSFVTFIVPRMRGESIELPSRLDQERNALLTFDDTLNNKLYDGLRLASYTWARPYMGDLHGKTLLDVGCGAGRETAHLWHLFGGQVKITAIDPVNPFIEMASERFIHYLEEFQPSVIASENHPTFHQMSAMALDFPDNSFDMVFFSAMLHWTPDPQQVIGEMLRVLKPGGIVFGTATHRPMTSPFVDIFVRVNEDVHGFFTYDQVAGWYRDGGVEFEHAIAGIHRGRKQA
jgi:SAM-dependent methyltransferase